MPYRGEVFAEGRYYHIYNRAITGELLFHSSRNYQYCRDLATGRAQRFGAGLIAYCLMPTHYHFLLRQDGEQPLSRFVNALFNAYVQALNRELRRRGPLFEGRFRYVWVDRDEYVWQLCRYIHLNPMKAGLVGRPEDWPYSDCREWFGLVPGSAETQAFRREFWGGPAQYRRFVAEGGEEADISRHVLE